MRPSFMLTDDGSDDVVSACDRAGSRTVRKCPLLFYIFAGSSVPPRFSLLLPKFEICTREVTLSINDTVTYYCMNRYTGIHTGIQCGMIRYGVFGFFSRTSGNCPTDHAASGESEGAAHRSCPSQITQTAQSFFVEAQQHSSSSFSSRAIKNFFKRAFVK